MAGKDIEVSIVMPCLNEAETIEICIRKAQSCIDKNGLSAEIVVADNGSTDGSQDIAGKAGARVVYVKEKGYGSALRGGIEAAHGRFIVMGDSDDSYDFSQFYPMIEELREGADLVMGNRFKGGIEPGAMPWKNKHIGNPIQTKIGQVIFGCPVGDFNCGLRAFTKDAYKRLGLVTTRWEFASEMVVKACLQRMKITEVPIVLSKDGRSRPPHLEPWRAGWRNIRFMFLHSPRWLFLIPGLVLTLLGLAGFAYLLPGPRALFGSVLDISTLVVSATMVLIGFQVIGFGVLARAFATSEGLLPPDPKTMWLQKRFGLEISLVTGFAFALGGIALLIGAFTVWSRSGFGPLEYQHAIRLAVSATTLIALGVQIGFTSFFMSVLELGRKR